MEKDNKTPTKENYNTEWGILYEKYEKFIDKDGYIRGSNAGSMKETKNIIQELKANNIEYNYIDDGWYWFRVRAKKKEANTQQFKEMMGSEGKAEAENPTSAENAQVETFQEKLQIELNKLPFTQGLDDGQFNDGVLYGFELGANWVKENLKSNN